MSLSFVEDRFNQVHIHNFDYLDVCLYIFFEKDIDQNGQYL